MLRQFTNPNGTQKILHGDDTDVSTTTIIKYSQEHYLVITTWVNAEDEEIVPTTEVVNSKRLKEMFDLQYGAPMHYFNTEEYEWLIAKK